MFLQHNNSRDVGSNLMHMLVNVF